MIAEYTHAINELALGVGYTIIVLSICYVALKIAYTLKK